MGHRFNKLPQNKFVQIMIKKAKDYIFFYMQLSPAPCPQQAGLLICFLLLFPAVSIVAQSLQKVKITVTDSMSSQSIGATIRIAAINKTLSTNEAGITSFSLKQGRYTLIVSSVGYAVKAVDIELKDKVSLSVAVSLTVMEKRLADVTVIGMTKEDAEARAIKRNVMPVTIITAKQIENRASDLNEILARQSGIQIRQSGGLGSDSRISIRGLEGKRVAIFIDGNPINTPDGSLALNDLPVQIIERVEIYKGAVPASFGSDGLGSAVNVVLKHKEASYIDAAITRRSFNTTQVSLIGKKHFDEKGIELSAGLIATYSDNDYKMESPYQKGFIIKRDHDQFHSSLAAAAIRFYKLWFDEIEIEGAFQKNFKQIQGIQQNIQHVERSIDSRFILVELNKEKFLRDRMKFKYIVNIDNFKTRFVDTSQYMYNFDGSRYASTIGIGEIGIGPNTATIAQNEFRHRLNVNYRISDEFLLNFNNTLRSAKFNPNDAVANQHAGRNIYNYPGSVFNTTTGLTAELKLLNEDLLIASGVKLLDYKAKGYNTNIFLISVPDNITTEFKKIGYNTGVRYNITPLFFLKSSYEHAIRLPLPSELFGDGLLTTPSLSLLPEEADNFSIGAIYDKVNSRQNRLQAECNVFYSKVNNLIQLAGSLTNGYINYRNVTIAGADIEIKSDISGCFFVQANATYQISKDALRYTPGTQNVANPTYKIQIPNVPSFFSNLNVEYHKSNLLGKNTKTKCLYEGSYVAKYFYGFKVSVFNDLVIPSYFLHNLAIEQSFKDGKFTITGEAQNFTNQHIINSYNLPLPGISYRIKFRCLLFSKNLNKIST